MPWVSARQEYSPSFGRKEAPHRLLAQPSKRRFRPKPVGPACAGAAMSVQGITTPSCPLRNPPCRPDKASSGRSHFLSTLLRLSAPNVLNLLAIVHGPPYPTHEQA